MILYGASGHAKVVFDICQINNNKVNAIIDDDINISSILGQKVIQLKNLKFFDDKMIVSIGNNRIRKNVVKKLDNSFGIVIHPNAVIDNSVHLKEGSVVMAGTIINSSTIIGKHCIINTSSSIDHDCTLGDFVHISPNATLCGGIQIGEGSQIGAGAVIIQNIKIGKWCTIGAGSVVVNDIPDGTTVVGNPAKKIIK